MLRPRLPPSGSLISRNSIFDVITRWQNQVMVLEYASLI